MFQTTSDNLLQRKTELSGQLWGIQVLTKVQRLKQLFLLDPTQRVQSCILNRYKVLCTTHCTLHQPLKRGLLNSIYPLLLGTDTKKYFDLHFMDRGVQSFIAFKWLAFKSWVCYRAVVQNGQLLFCWIQNIHYCCWITENIFSKKMLSYMGDERRLFCQSW